MRSIFQSLLAAFCFSFGLSVQAEELSIDLLDKLRLAQPAMDLAAKQFPNLDQDFKLSSLLKDKGVGLIESLRNVGAYETLNKTSKQHGLASVDQFIELMSRLLSAQMALEFENQDPKDIAQLENMNLTELREQLVAQGVPASMVDSQMEAMQEMKSAAVAAKDAVKNVPAEDLSFVRSNLAKVESVMGKF